MKLDTIGKAIVATTSAAIFASIVMWLAVGDSYEPGSAFAAVAVCVMAFFLMCLIHKN